MMISDYFTPIKPLNPSDEKYSYRGSQQIGERSWEYEREVYERRIKELEAQLETAKQAYTDLLVNAVAEITS